VSIDIQIDIHLTVNWLKAFYYLDWCWQSIECQEIRNDGKNANKREQKL